MAPTSTNRYNQLIKILINIPNFKHIFHSFCINLILLSKPNFRHIFPLFCINLIQFNCVCSLSFPSFSLNYCVDINEEMHSLGKEIEDYAKSTIVDDDPNDESFQLNLLLLMMIKDQFFRENILCFIFNC